VVLVHLLPSHCSARGDESATPTATQNWMELQETLVRGTYPPGLGFTVGTTDQLLPSHFSPSVAIPLLPQSTPTAIHDDDAAQETEENQASLSGLGEDVVSHEDPFHVSARV
jgi:hypothetical protein